jgi:hypothetical protein
MKHGDNAKKSAKAVQASGKQGSKSSSKEAVAKTSSKESGSSTKSQSGSKEAGPKAGAKKAGVEAGAKASAKTAAKAPAREAADKNGGNGKAKVVDSGGPSFANPIVGASFKRAVKKYATAFRRLTD